MQPGLTPSESGLAYDSLANRYDRLLLENPVLAHSARVSIELVKNAMRDCQFILELGCGTGRETLEIASMKKTLVACDPSIESLEVLRTKSLDRGLTQQVLTRNIPASKIAVLLTEFGEHSFDGGFASFSLSYERDLRVVVSDLWRLLKPGSPFFCTLFNRVCASEIVLCAPLLLPRRALRRLEGETRLPVDRHAVRLKSYSPREVHNLFSRDFVRKNVWGIPAIMPPHYLHLLVRWSGGLRPAWERLDKQVNHKWPLKYLGSHTAYLFESVS